MKWYARLLESGHGCVVQADTAMDAAKRLGFDPSGVGKDPDTGWGVMSVVHDGQPCVLELSPFEK